MIKLKFRIKRKKRDFDKWARSASIKDLEKLTKDWEEGIEVDMINNVWGHCFYVNEKKQLSPLISYGYGFYAGGQLLGTRRLKEGDVLLLNTQSGKIGRYLIINIKYERNPQDMFWAYLGCIGYK